MKRAFRFDLNRCTGCHACILACANENGLPPDRPWRQVVTFNSFRHPGLPLFNLSLACNHCDEPACMINCPAAAYKKDPETGAVLLDPDRCIGCTYCTWACPFDAPRYHSQAGVVEKCNFCNERLRKNLEPACVACCPMGALQLADRREKEAEPRVPGFSKTRMKPAVEFISLRLDRPVPEITAPPDPAAIRRALGQMLIPPPRKITLRSEWALLLFTIIASGLVSLLTAGIWRSFRPAPIPFFGAGAGAMLLSTAHLGRKERAWRAIAHWRSSWLSLEILFFSLFLGSAGLFLLFFPGVAWLGLTSAGIGFFALFAVDRIYRVALKIGPGNLHSGQSLLNGFYLTGIFALSPGLFIPAGLFKLFLYLQRKILAYRRRLPFRPVAVILRIIFGFIIPFSLLLGPADSHVTVYLWAAAAAVAGDLIDRGEFYQELEVLTPRKQMLADLQEQLNLIESKE